MKNGGLKESRPHEDALVGMGVYETAGSSAMEKPLYVHWHNELEIFYLVMGKLKMQVNEEEFIMEAGDVAVIKPGCFHGSDSNYGLPFRFRAILVSYEFMTGMANDLIAQKYFQPIFSSEESRTYLLLKNRNLQNGTADICDYLERAASYYAEKRDGCELMIKGLMYQVFYEIYLYRKAEIQTGLISDGNTGNAQLAKQIIEYIREHYKEKITLADISSEFSLSEGYFCRYFKKYYHMTFGEYLSRIRLHDVEQLLLHTEYDIEKIATETGFSSAAYMTACFKKEYQITPTKYRKKYK